MSDPDIVPTWTLRRGSGIGKTRFHLACEITAEFVEPTRDEVRTALAQILDESLGPDEVIEIAGWTDTPIEFDSAVVEGQFIRLTPELERLRAWKEEALPLLDILEECHNLLPAPYQAHLGRNKAIAVRNFLITQLSE